MARTNTHIDTDTETPRKADEMVNDSPTAQLFADAKEVLTERWNDENNHVEGCLGDLFSTLLAEVMVVEEEWEGYGHVMGDYSFLQAAISETKAFRVGLIEGQMKALRIMSHMIGTEINRASRADFFQRLAADPRDTMQRLIDGDIPGVDVQIVPLWTDEMREKFVGVKRETTDRS